MGEKKNLVVSVFFSKAFGAVLPCICTLLGNGLGNNLLCYFNKKTSEYICFFWIMQIIYRKNEFLGAVLGWKRCQLFENVGIAVEYFLYVAGVYFVV